MFWALAIPEPEENSHFETKHADSTNVLGGHRPSPNLRGLLRPFAVWCCEAWQVAPAYVADFGGDPLDLEVFLGGRRLLPRARARWV